MPTVNYVDTPASLVGLRPGLDLIQNERAAAVFDFRSNLVAVLDPDNPTNSTILPVEDALSGAPVTFTRATTAWGVGRLGLITSWASGVPRQVYDPASKITSTSTLHKRLRAKALTVTTEFTYSAGDIVAMTDAGDTADWMMAKVISHVGTLLVVDVFWVHPDALGGSASSWIICKSLGYLPEPSRINIATYSEDFRNTAEAGGTRPWTRVSCTVATANITGPDGTTSGTTVTENASGSGQCNAQNAMSFTSGTSYTVSVFQRYIGRRYVQLFFGAAAFGANAYVNFDLTDLTVGTVGSAVTGYGIKDCGNGWVRIWCTAPATSTASSSAVWGHIDSSTAARAPSITLSGLTSGLYGFQVEAGAYPTSYIPTPSSSTVTRNADVMTVALSKLPFSATAFMLQVNAEATPNPTNGQPYLLSVTKSGSSAERSHLRAGTPTTSVGQVNVTGGSATANSTAGATGGGRFKLAARFKADDFSYSVNGVSINTDTSGAMPSGLETLEIGYWSGDSPWAGALGAVVVLPRGPTNAELNARTA